MPRLTKADLIRKLLTGETVSWTDANGKGLQLTLSTARQRRLFQYVLNANVRSPIGIPDSFLKGLSAAFKAVDDPANDESFSVDRSAVKSGPWRLRSVTTQGFGGLNVWGQSECTFEFDCNSLLLEGPNGSGKSSLTGAIIWALSGELPREQSDTKPGEAKPVYNDDQKAVGQWPPLATYPDTIANLRTTPKVTVKLVFQNDNGEEAIVQRTLTGDETTASASANFRVPAILLETGLLMPARLSSIRLAGGRGRLTDAVQKLSGMDGMIGISDFVDGLCHRGREYLMYKRKEFASANKEFDASVGEARGLLEEVGEVVPEFYTKDTDDKSGALAILGKRLNEKATELFRVISADISAGLDLTNTKTQHDVISAIGAAEEDVRNGLSHLTVWETLSNISADLTDEKVTELKASIELAKAAVQDALRFEELTQQDNRFQLKALAAQWHASHLGADVIECPLCQKDLADNPKLLTELQLLKSAGDAASKKLEDNINAILADLSKRTPSSVNKLDKSFLNTTPDDAIAEEFRILFVEKDRYKNILEGFRGLIVRGLTNCPMAMASDIFVVSPANTGVPKIDDAITQIQIAIELKRWFTLHNTDWLTWWNGLAGVSPTSGTEIEEAVTDSTLNAYLFKVSDALSKSNPYRKAAAAFRKAWKAGLESRQIEAEIELREEITDDLAPLKRLSSIAESVARDAIESLSGKIARLLKTTLLTENLRFRKAHLSKREGLRVDAGFVEGFHIDATLVANTSWLRAVLWAFIFALREEAIEHATFDAFPFFVFDDPQSTFDTHHRHRWSQYIASLQNGSTPAQIILTTYDNSFFELIKVVGVTGREGLIDAANRERGNAVIVEGAYLDREWQKVLAARSDVEARGYLKKVREHIETVLRIMLRGEDPTVSSPTDGFVLGSCRDKIERLHDKGLAPWDRSDFRTLARSLGKNVPEIRHLEISHHSGNALIGLAEATDVETYWQKHIRTSLMKCFRMAQEFHLFHGGLSGLHAANPSALLPDGYEAEIIAVPLTVLGRASALTDGRQADGCIDLGLDDATQRKVTLAKHSAYRLVCSSLAPIARTGDILLTSDLAEPCPKSLVIASVGNQLLARRFDIAENFPEVAVLSVQSGDSLSNAQPVVGHKASLHLKKIVGVIYGNDHNLPVPEGHEVSDCGETTLPRLFSGKLGLVEIIGDSAAPCALNGQFILLREAVTSSADLTKYVGKPVIAADSSDGRFFKRLQLVGGKIVLESLDPNGDHPPIVLNVPGDGDNSLTDVWPVAGVLFELPG